MGIINHADDKDFVHSVKFNTILLQIYHHLLKDSVKLYRATLLLSKDTLSKWHQMLNDNVRLGKWLNVIFLCSTLASTQYSISIFIKAFKFSYHLNGCFNLRLNTLLINNSNKVLVNLLIKCGNIIINNITRESWYLRYTARWCRLRRQLFLRHFFKQKIDTKTHKK